MADELVFNIEANDNASADLEKVQKEIKETGDATEKSGKQADKSAKSTEKYGEALKGAGAAAAILAAAATKSVLAAREQRKVDEGVVSALVRAGETREGALRSLSAAQAEFAKNQAKGLVGDEEQSKVFAKLVNATGDYSKALELTNLSLDVASRNNIDFAAAAEEVQKAALGDIGALKGLGFASKDVTAKMEQLKDESQRSALALGLMQEKAGGARFKVDSLDQGIEQLKNDTGDAVQAVGELVIKIGELTGAMNLLVGDGTLLGDFVSDLTLGTKAIDALSESMGAAEIAATLLTAPLAVLSGPVGLALYALQFDNAAEAAARLIEEQDTLNAALELSTRNLASVQNLTPKAALGDVSDEDRAAAMKKEQDNRDAIEAKRLAKQKEWANKRQAAADAAFKELQAATQAHNAAILEMDAMLVAERGELLDEWVEANTAAAEATVEIWIPAVDEQLAKEIELSDARKASGIVALETISAMSEGFTAANDLIAVHNEGLAESIGKWGELGMAIGNLSGPLFDLAQAQDDHAAAAAAGSAALSGLSAVGGAVAEVVAEDVQEQAAWRAAFEAAAAVAATAAAFFNPLFAPAAVQHGVAAGMFGLVAGGVIGGGGGGGGGGSAGGSGGGGGGGIGALPDLAGEREANAQAFADKFAEQQAVQGIVINVDLGRNNVIPTESDRFARIVTDASLKGIKNVVGVGA